MQNIYSLGSDKWRKWVSANIANNTDSVDAALAAAEQLAVDSKNSYLAQDGAIIYHILPWINAGSVSNTGVSVIGSGTAFTSAMVGSKLIFNGGEYGIILSYQSSTSVTLDRVPTSNYSGVSFEVRSKKIDYTISNGKITFYSKTGNAQLGNYPNGDLENIKDIYSSGGYIGSNSSKIKLGDVQLQRKSGKAFEINNGTPSSFIDLYLKNVVLSTYSSLKVGFLGDSITWYGFESTYGTGWCLKLMDLLNIPRTNAYCYGIGGNRLCVNSDGDTEAVAGGWAPYGGASIATTARAMTVRYVEMRDDLDVVVVLAGTNDANVNPIGTINDTVLTTVYGAYKNLIQGLTNKYRGKTIIYATILHASTFDSIRMQISQAIRECCNLYGVQYLEFSNNLGIGSLNIGIQTPLSVTWSITGKGMNTDGTEMPIADGWMGNPALSNFIPVTQGVRYYSNIQQYYCIYDIGYNPLIVRSVKPSLLFSTYDIPASGAFLRLMSINTGGNLPTNTVVGDIEGVALPDGSHPSQWGHDKVAVYAYNEIKKWVPVF